MLVLQELNRKWGSFYLQDINLTVNEGEYFVLLGPCGSGKTLLLETICGFWQLTAGKIILDSKEVTACPPEKRNFSLVYQEPLLFPHLSIEENIFYGFKSRRIRLDNDKKQMMDSIKEILSLQELIDRKNPTILSGGQRQIVSIARALFSFPEVLFLDEPFHSLDYRLKCDMTDILKKIHGKFGLSVIHVTHNFDEAKNFSSRIGFISGGRILRIGNELAIKEFLKSFYHVQDLS